MEIMRLFRNYEITYLWWPAGIARKMYSIANCPAETATGYFRRMFNVGCHISVARCVYEQKCDINVGNNKARDVFEDLNIQGREVSHCGEIRECMWNDVEA
jgi:hypothetical protein